MEALDTESVAVEKLPATLFRKAALFTRKDAAVAMKKVRDASLLPLLSKTTQVFRPYKYKLLPGNNVRVVLASLRKRPWWHSVSKIGAAETESTSESTPTFLWEMYRNPKRYRDGAYGNVLLNHLQNNNCLVTKKGLYFSLKAYCEKNPDIDLLKIIPRTFYLSAKPCEAAEDGDGEDDPDHKNKNDLQEFLRFNESMKQQQRRSSVTTLREVVKSSAAAHTDFTADPDAPPPTELQLNQDLDTTIAAMSTVVVAAAAVPPPPPSSSTRDDGIVWIMKPASMTNRGYGITVVRGVAEVMAIVNRAGSAVSGKGSRRGSRGGRGKGGVKGGGGGSSKPSAGSQRKNNKEKEKDSSGGGGDGKKCEGKGPESVESLSRAASRRARQEGWIVQQYMLRPLLVSGRKFDIRCFVLMTNFGRQGLRAYFFREAYVRTSSKKYTLNSLADREAHLTNDAVQKNSKTYGKFEDGNKLSFAEWQEQIDRDYPNAPKNVVEGKLRPEIRRLSAISIAAAAEKLKKTDISKSFELLGYDYMVDDNFEPTLIEINSNPCLEFVCPLLTYIISSVIEHTMKVALDTQFPPPPLSMRTAATTDAINELGSEELMFDQIYPTPL